MRAVQLTYRRNLLDHTFYRRWVAGDLSIDELREYAAQYSHVVIALPKWLRQAASSTPTSAAQLERHAVEEDGHVALWHRFATALGVTASELATTTPTSATAALLRCGDELSAQPSGAAVAWALEVQTPAVSAKKLRGLEAHYRIDSRSGGEYFDVHLTLDLEHAAELVELIASLDPSHHSEAQRTADVMIDSQWDLLTSVERAA